VYRTDQADSSCCQRRKVGEDDDGRPGGCDSIRFLMGSGYAAAVDACLRLFREKRYAMDGT
jgi:hypothetical protein